MDKLKSISYNFHAFETFSFLFRNETIKKDHESETHAEWKVVRTLETVFAKCNMCYKIGDFLFHFNANLMSTMMYGVFAVDD